jgi:hypothetical protein
MIMLDLHSMQRDFPWTIDGFAFHFVHDICTTKALADQGFVSCAKCLSLAQQLWFSRWSYSAKGNEPVVAFTGLRYDFGMIVDVAVSCSADLTSLDLSQFDPLRIEVFLDRLPCVPSC